jgi:vacuolar-type H+-ATPase subunit C/Vma6
MTRVGWEDLAIRARGLSTHLLDRASLASLAASEGLDALAAALQRAGYPLPERIGGITADDLELAVRRQAASRLQTLARWARNRPAVLAVVFEDEERRSVRALVRGAIQGAPAELRLAGLIPTPALPERALRELAEQPAAGAVAVLLTAWGNGYGPALIQHAKATQPNLWAIESTLTATFARRALESARDTRSSVVVDYVRDTVDLENALAALVLAGEQADTSRSREEAFVAGGRRVSLVAFLAAVAAGNPHDAARRLALAFRPTPLAMAFERAQDASDIEERLLRSRILMLRAAARRDPAGAASVLEFALCVRAEVCAVRRVIWGVALRAPQDALVPA